MNRRGIFVGLTEWQKGRGFEIFKNYFSEYNVELDLIKLDEAILSLGDNDISIDVDKYDFCVMLSRDQHIASLFENKRCFNNYKSMCFCDDKFLSYIKLSQYGVPMPKTILIKPYVLENNQILDDKKSEIEDILKYPFIAKPNCSYGGKGVELINNRDELNSFFDKIGKEEYILQEFIADNVGTDLRCVVIGEEVVFSYKRVNFGNVVSNISQGGVVEQVEVGLQHKEMALKVAKILGLDYCSVDFFNKSDVLLCEVNANPIYRKFKGDDQYKKYVYYIVNQIYSN